MSNETEEQQSQLVGVLREGISVVQMILFKQVRANLQKKYTDKKSDFHSMMAGAVTNELFGSPNQEERFVRFRADNHGILEQELLSFTADFPELLAPLTDALRVQALCDSREGNDDTEVLNRADELGVLQKDREVPLPTAFMTMVRSLGEKNNLIIPPVQVNPEHDTIIH